MANVEKPTIFTGITPTGGITLGHYFSIIREILKIQDNYNVIIMIADLHALTNLEKERIDYKEKIKEISSILLSCGLKCKIFVQSEIPYHLYLSHIISSYVPVSKLENMIQYKEKRKNFNSSASIFNYPILMSSDILLYNPDLVIVGKDQKQHLELNSYIFKKINRSYPDLFNLPNYYIPSLGGKIMDLKDPSIKMSKSNKRSIFLLDSEDCLEKKIMSSKTDSFNRIIYDPLKSPGISNLITIYALLENISIEECQENFKDKDYNFFKKELIVSLKSKLLEIKRKYEEKKLNIDKILEKNNKFFNKIAKKNFEKIKSKIGLWN